MIKKFIQWLKSFFPSKINQELSSAPKIINVTGTGDSKLFTSIPKEQKFNPARNAKIRNVRKHLRIAAAIGLEPHRHHERMVHIERAEKLIKRYGFTPLDRNLV